MKDEAIRVALADDHEVFRLGIKSLLENSSNPRFKVVIEVENGNALVEQLAQTSVDLLILDLRMPGKNGLEVLELIQSENPSLKVVVLSMFTEWMVVNEVLSKGAQAYVLKQGNPGQIITAIQQLWQGNTFVSPELNQPKEPYSSLTNGNNPSFSLQEKGLIEAYGLTKRELEVLTLIGQAMNNQGIANYLEISVQTVNVHRKHLMRKLGVQTSVGLIRIAFQYKQPS